MFGVVKEKIGVWVMTTAAATKGLSTVRYVFDPTVSRFTVQCFATGLLSVFGHNPTIAIRDFEGGVEFIPSTYEKAFVNMNVNTTTFEVLDEMKQNDREKLQDEMFDSVLDVARFSRAMFESNRIEVQSQTTPLVVNIDGQLTLRGVTHPHSFSARVSNADTSLRIFGDFSLLQSDYGIRPVSFAGGALRLKDELKFRFEVVAKRDG
jgi:polyisoprenoid-binding protein YceI